MLRYQVVLELGRTDTDVTALALAHGPMWFRRACVLKRLRYAASRDPARRRAFFTEAALAARVHHSNLVESVDCGEEGGVPYFARAYVEGEPLRRVLKAATELDIFPAPAMALHIAAEALAGLHAFHELVDHDGELLAPVHRMVSTDAIVIGHDGGVRLLLHAGARSALDRGYACEIAGKEGYMAPEYVERGALDRRIDVFAMGVVLWEMLARRRPPFSDLPSPALAGELPAVSTRAPGLDPSIDGLVAKAVAADPAERFASAQLFREAILGYLVESRDDVRRERVAEMVGGYFADARERLRATLRDAATRAADGPNADSPFPAVRGTDIPPRLSSH